MIRPPLCVLLLTCAARGSVVLEPSSSRPLATTTLKFFGPQTFSLNATGSPLIELSAADLAQIQRDGRASTDVAGAIVVFNFADIPNPASEWLWYIALERAGATAVLTTTTLFRIPGGLYHANDGSTRSSGLARSGAMPMLQVAWWDVSDLVEAARAGATVSLQLEPSVNKFRPFWHSWAWVLGIRGLMPLLGFTTGGGRAQEPARAYPARRPKHPLAADETSHGPCFRDVRLSFAWRLLRRRAGREYERLDVLEGAIFRLDADRLECLHDAHHGGGCHVMRQRASSFEISGTVFTVPTPPSVVVQ